MNACFGRMWKLSYPQSYPPAWRVAGWRRRSGCACLRSTGRPSHAHNSPGAASSGERGAANFGLGHLCTGTAGTRGQRPLTRMDAGFRCPRRLKSCPRRVRATGTTLSANVRGRSGVAGAAPRFTLRAGTAAVRDHVCQNHGMHMQHRYRATASGRTRWESARWACGAEFRFPPFVHGDSGDTGTTAANPHECWVSLSPAPESLSPPGPGNGDNSFRGCPCMLRR
jgi:hypothetical protein